MFKFILSFVFLLLSGCALQQQKNNNLAQLLLTQPPSVVLEKLYKADRDPRDLVQFHLNLGLLQLMNGEFSNAIYTLTLVKREMAALQASSVSENLGAGLVSEVLRSYSGYPTDQLMVYNMLALSYLFNNDLNGARVEVLQADVAMKKMASKKAFNDQLASSHLLAGIIYELLDEQSNALISYRSAAEMIKKRGSILPLGLKQALLRLSFSLGATAQYNTYQTRFPELVITKNDYHSQNFILYFDGLISHKIQNSIMVPDHHNKQLLRISMPAYPQYKKLRCPIKISQNDVQLTTELVDNLEKQVRDDLAIEYPSILLLTTTRAIAKYQLVKKAQEKEPLLGLLANIATLLTEQADLRSWNMLPSNIQFAYLEASEGKFRIDSCSATAKQISVANGSKNVFLMLGLSNKIFRYQQ